MEIVRYEPFRELDRLQNEMNRIFDGFLSPAGTPRSAGPAPRTWAPSVDIAESENALLLRAELPGMKIEDVDIELAGDTLTIRGERHFDGDETRQHFVRVERSYGRFQRSFTLGVPIESDQVTASYRDGILEVTLPKSEETRPRKVAVTTSA